MSWDWTSAENTIVAAVIVAGLTVASLIAIGLIISRMVARCCYLAQQRRATLQA